jgi:hypothetical protein
MSAPKLLAAVACLAAACATAGPAPDPTMAILGARGVVLDNIDDHGVRDDQADPSRAHFEIPPGRHTLAVSLYTGSPPPGGDAKTVAVCFGAVAGHSYTARPVVVGTVWHPEIIDETTGDAVEKGCPAAVSADPAGAETTAVASSPAEVSTAPASLPVTAPPVRPPSDLPSAGVTAGLGFFFGGESLYDVRFTNAPDRSLSAGRGVMLSVGGLWTPLWSDSGVGFGLGAEVGWKYDSISADNGSVSLNRFPFDLTAHALIRIDHRWFVLLKGGLASEVGGHVEGTGFAAGTSYDLTCSWGPLGDGSLYYRFDRVAVGAGLRYTRLSDEIQGTRFNASSLGIVGSGQYAF